MFVVGYSLIYKGYGNELCIMSLMCNSKLALKQFPMAWMFKLKAWSESMLSFILTYVIWAWPKKLLMESSKCIT